MAPRICPSQREAVSESTLAAAHIIPTYAALPQMGLRISLPTLGSVRRRGRPHPAHGVERHRSSSAGTDTQDTPQEARYSERAPSAPTMHFWRFQTDVSKTKPFSPHRTKNPP